MSVLVENDIQASRKLISHLEHDQDNINFDKSQLEKNLKQKKDIVLPLSEELSLLNQLTQFELGRFLLSNKGLNGYWTSYIIIHGPKQQNLLPLEKWLLEDAPVVKATIERFYIFQKALQKNIREGIKIASIPCGLMDDLLFLNYNRIRQFTLLGIDLDDNSLELAKKNAEDQDVHVQFLKRDAWQLNINEEYDIITSNGLNIYEADEERVVELYRQFYKAIKPKGLLITSFLTPPHTLSKASTWKNINSQDAIKQKAIFGDIISAAWQSFRTEYEVKERLKRAGFQVVEVIYDTQGMFPSIIAKKN